MSEIARYDPAFALDGLFVPRASMTDAVRLEAEYDLGVIRIAGVQLGAKHQSVLLAICALTGTDGLKVVPDEITSGFLTVDRNGQQDPAPERAINAVAGLFASVPGRNNSARSSEMSLVDARPHRILTAAGMKTGGRDYEELATLLTEIASVTVYRRVGGQGASSHILSFSHDTDALTIVLNWRLARAILGDGEYQYSKISLEERRQIKSPVGKILHAWLCCRVNEGKRFAPHHGVQLDTLIPRVWGVRPGCIRKRRQQLRKALCEIDIGAGWTVSFSGKREDRVHIGRPKSAPAFGY